MEIGLLWKGSKQISPPPLLKQLFFSFVTSKGVLSFYHSVLCHLGQAESQHNRSVFLRVEALPEASAYS